MTKRYRKIRAKGICIFDPHSLLWQTAQLMTLSSDPVYWWSDQDHIFALQAQMPALLLSGQRYPYTQFSYLFLRSCAVFQAPVLINGFRAPCRTEDWLCSGRFYLPEHVRDNYAARITTFITTTAFHRIHLYALHNSSTFLLIPSRHSPTVAASLFLLL